MTTDKYLGPQIIKRENINNVTLLAYPEFAKELYDRFGVRNGLLLSLLIGQLAFWINKSTTKPLGNLYWTYQSFREMQHKAFPFVSYSTLQRAVKSLLGAGILIISNFNKKSYDRTHWYTFRAEKLAEFTSISWVQPISGRPKLKPNFERRYPVFPELAKEIGLNESIVLLQIAYFIYMEKMVRDGHNIALQSRQHLRDWFPYLSESTLNNKIAALRERELIFETADHKYEFRTKHRVFSLNVEQINKLESIKVYYEPKFFDPYKFSKFNVQNK